jgi:hypothetical protein
MTWFSTTQTNIIYTLPLLLLLHERFDSCFINLHGVVLSRGCQKLGWHCSWILFFLLMVVQNSFVLLMCIHGAFLFNVRRARYHTEQLVQWPNLMLKGFVK